MSISTPRGLIWVFGIASVGLQAGCLYLLGKDSVPILTAGIAVLMAAVSANAWVNRNTDTGTTTPRGLIWVFGIAATALQVASLLWLGKECVPILTIGIPAMMGAVGTDVVANRNPSTT